MYKKVEEHVERHAPFFANKCVVQATARDGGQSDYLTYFGGNGTGAAKELA